MLWPTLGLRTAKEQNKSFLQKEYMRQLFTSELLLKISFVENVLVTSVQLITKMSQTLLI